MWEGSVVADGSFILTDSLGSHVTGTIHWVGSTAVFLPYTVLSGNMVYTATITTMASDVFLNSLAANHQWSFTTTASVDLTAPLVTVVTPTNGITDASIHTPVRAAFSEALDPTTVTASTFIVTSGSGTVTGPVSYVGGVASIATGTLTSNTLYTVTPHLRNKGLGIHSQRSCSVCLDF